MRGLILALDPGEKAHIGRTQRAIAQAGLVAEIVASREELIERLCAADEPVLLIAAGAWFVTSDALPPIPASATGLPLIALGAVRHSSHPHAEQWRAVLERRGADFDARRFFAPKIPPPACAMLEPIAAHRLGAFLKSGDGLPAAWCRLLAADALLNAPVFDVSPGEMYFASLARYFANPRAGLPYLTPHEYGARLAGVVVKYAAESDLAARILGVPVCVIRNGVGLDETPRTPRRNSPLIIGTAARLSPAKRIGDLLDAIRIAAPRLPRFTLRIAGGQERGFEAHARELRKQARDLPVKWCGEIADTRAFLADLDLFTMISEPSGCPNASLEAMATGVPVIATDLGGASEQIVNGLTGILTPPRDAPALAEAIVQLAHDAPRRESFAQAAREHIRSEFPLDRMLDAFSQLCGLPNAVR